MKLSIVASALIYGLLSILLALCGCAGKSKDDAARRGTDSSRVESRSTTISSGAEKERLALPSEVVQETVVKETKENKGNEAGRDTESARTQAAREAEVLALIVAIDEHEAKAGAEAAKKQLRPAVLDFAKTMQSEHARHADDTRSLAKSLGLTLVDTSAVTSQREQGERGLSSLASFSGDAFETAYVDAMIKGHEDVLAKLDGFLSECKREELRAHLRQTREAVARHLEMARGLKTGAR